MAETATTEQTLPDAKGWCAGLPLVGTRPLTEKEIQSLRRQAQQYGLLGWGLGLAFPLLYFATFLWQMEVLPVVMQGGEVLVIIPLLLAAIFCAIRGRSWRQRGSGLLADLRQGTALRFEGKLVPNPYDHAQRILVSPFPKMPARLSADPERIQSLELLPHSQRLFYVNGTFVMDWLAITWQEPAQTPEIAHIKAQWLTPIPNAAQGQPTAAGHRELTPQETQEIGKRWRRILRPHVFQCPILMLLFSGFVAVSLDSGEGSGLIITAAFAIYYSRYLWRRVRIVPKLRRDEKQAQVLIFQVPAEIVSDTEETQRVELILEYLPFSRLLWTQEGKPSAWRTATAITNNEKGLLS